MRTLFCIYIALNMLKSSSSSYFRIIPKAISRMIVLTTPTRILSTVHQPSS